MKTVGDYKYYAFSDQDDVWDENKLTCAVELIKKKETDKPIIYWCNLRLVDKNLNAFGDMEAPNDTDFKKGRYLIDKYGYGCTNVFNKGLRDLALRYEPRNKISHDNWIGLIGIFLGDYVFDDQTHISYRQHGNNVIGGNDGLIGTWIRRIKALKKIKQYSRALVAQEILSGYTDLLGDDDIKLLGLVANYKVSIRNKVSLIRNKQISRASKEKDAWFKIMIIFSLA